MIAPGMVHTSSGFCIRNYQSAKYLPKQLNAHVVAYATCTAGPAASLQGSNLNPSEMADPPPRLPVPTSPPPFNGVSSWYCAAKTVMPDGTILRCTASHVLSEKRMIIAHW